MAQSPFTANDRLSETISAGMLAAVRRAVFHEWPFGHLLIDSFLDASVYSQCLQALPEAGAYVPYMPSKYRRDDGIVTRTVLPLDDAGLDRVSQGQRETWRSVRDGLLSRSVKECLFERLGVDESRATRPPVRVRVMLLRDFGGYWIDPHRDNESLPAKVVSIQLYLPQDDSQRELGTTLYTKTGDEVNGRYDPARQIAFLPNTGYGFAVSDRSWHGRERIDRTAQPRDSILLFYCDDAGLELVENHPVIGAGSAASPSSASGTMPSIKAPMQGF